MRIRTRFISFVGILAATSVLCLLWAQAPRHQKPFGIKIQGVRSQIKALQVRAELQAARDTRYCRGPNIPVPEGEWTCESAGPGVERCERPYRCARIWADLSRLTETRRLISQVRQVGAPTGESSIEFYPDPSLPTVAPLRSVEKRVASGLDSRSSRERQARPSEISRSSLPKRKRNSLELRMEPLDKIQTASELVESQTQGSEASSLDAQLDSLGDEEDFDDLLEEEPGPVERTETFEDEQDFEDLMAEADDSEQEVQESGQEDSSDSGFSGLKLDWKKVSVSWVNSSNEFEESQSQFDLAWTPELTFTQSWSVLGQLGGHTYTVPTLEGEESFYVIDTFAHLQYSFWEDWSVWAGLGQQRWNYEEAVTLSGLALGAARDLDWGYLDQVYIQRVTLSGEEDTSLSELRFGATFSF